MDLKMEKHSEYSINITPVVGGFYVCVGCHARVYMNNEADHDRMALDLREYLRDPRTASNLAQGIVDDRPDVQGARLTGGGGADPANGLSRTIAATQPPEGNFSNE